MEDGEELKCPLCKNDLRYIKAWGSEHVVEYRCANCNRLFIVAGGEIL